MVLLKIFHRSRISQYSILQTNLHVKFLNYACMKGLHTFPQSTNLWQFFCIRLKPLLRNTNYKTAFRKVLADSTYSSVNTCLYDKTTRLFSNINNNLTVLSAQFARQIKALMVQRLRRSAQIIKFYEELGYDKKYIQSIFSNLRKRLLKFKKENKFVALVGAVGFNWKEQQITDDEVKQVESEMDFVTRNIESKNKTDRLEEHFKDGWEVVFKKQNLIAWRQPVAGSSFYKYKLYGSIKDIPARAFYHAQIDIDYRKQWDKIVIDLDIIDHDPETNNQVVHWTMNFPYPMYPREYVYIRRFKVDSERNMLYTMSHSCSHPRIPVTSKFVRVETYISNMVIRPHKTFDENGFDYILTYYDEPKSNFPTFAYNWMASTGVPDFVEKMYNAARYLHEHGKGVSNENKDEQSKSSEAIL